VRSYIVENDGAGYKASIVNLLEGQDDKWFRPVDVTSAPDGSIFIADWYDPGVGGHQAGDIDKGRIYRVAPPDTDYKIQSFDISSPETAASALINPNTDIRYRAWVALKTFGNKAEPALLKLWQSGNARHRAQALWLLAGLDNKRNEYLQQAIEDEDPNIRITGIRVARQIKKDFLSLISGLTNDPSIQVRREVVLALRGIGTNQAADLWSTMALQYDGKDRWYLEALGIGASSNWDLYFDTWKKRVGKDWNSESGKDIVWRSRSKSAIPLLAELIKSSDETEMLRYFRAFDFHTDRSKQLVLAQIAIGSKDSKVLFALKHIDASKFKITPALIATLNKVLDQNEGTLEFVELASAFKLHNRVQDLLALCIQQPDSAAGKEAANLLLNWNRTDLFEKVFYSNDREKSQALIKVLASQMWNEKTMKVMEKVMLDSTKDIEIRKQSVRTFCGPWGAEDFLLALAKDKKIPEDLQTTAAGVFQTAYRSNIREDGAKYLKLPGSKEGTPLPSITVLVEKKGNASHGKTVFQNLCSNCHQVNKEGVNFGPGLSEIGDKLSKDALFSSILYPDQGISFGYEAYTIKLKDGSTAFGRIVSETADKLDLQYIGTQQTISKTDIVAKTKLETSLMPGNLQSSMSEEDLVDLVSYLETLKRENIEDE
jgi:putative heme-binding domain-containing protein